MSANFVHFYRVIGGSTGIPGPPPAAIAPGPNRTWKIHKQFNALFNRIFENYVYKSKCLPFALLVLHSQPFELVLFPIRLVQIESLNLWKISRMHYMRNCTAFSCYLLKNLWLFHTHFEQFLETFLSNPTIVQLTFHLVPKL